MTIAKTIFATAIALSGLAPFAHAESAAEVIEPADTHIAPLPVAPKGNAETPGAVSPAPNPVPVPPPIADNPAPVPQPVSPLQPPGPPLEEPHNTQPVSRLPMTVNEPDFKATAVFPEKPVPKFDLDPIIKSPAKPHHKEFIVSAEEGVPVTAAPDKPETAPEAEEISPLLAKAIAREKKDNKKAKELVALYQEVTAAEPENAEAHYRLALALRRNNDLRGALQSIDQALKLKPNNLKFKCDFGILALQAGWVERALEACKAAAQGAPGNARYQSALGDALMSANDLNEAAEVYMRAVNIEPKNAEFYHNLGKAFLYGRAYKRAGEVLDEAIKLRPDNATYYCTRGLAYQSDKGIKEAIGCYNLAIRADKNNAYAHYLLAGIYSDPEDPTYMDTFQSLDHADKACKLTDKKNPQYLMGLARALRVNHNYEQAITVSKMALLIEPRDEWRRELADYEKLLNEGREK